MRATNHALTGAVIGLTIANPALALPLAFLSHFAQDAIPHYDNKERFPLGSKQFTQTLLADAFLCGVLVLVLAVSAPERWLASAVCAFLATSPDLMWIPRYMYAERTGIDPGPKGVIQRFHALVQWCERKWGLFVEIPWFVGMAVTLWWLIR